MAGCPLCGRPAGAAYVHRYESTAKRIRISACLSQEAKFGSLLSSKSIYRFRGVPLGFLNQLKSPDVRFGFLRASFEKWGNCFGGNGSKRLLFSETLRKCHKADVPFFHKERSR